ncbi:1,4-dihydroxy-6-naphthoate synthase [Flavihumibacter stibioxidans]|uniref:1,4-dihydroxy-6-naphtoate synthase n=1 Tax=Flavihumibacter stibioxidans TaxID=1834163 RepID=A0ABR7MCI5_9BACT|nr:1,4-dihydroxy-6-naphthoate synthase [Flavihumibacter stibioxidans]MBC6492539.1 1,4-dihydroxy-6-naphthoate synthase [Flavihumibacter stibioxidans]
MTLAFSPCPNDTFIFDALVNGKIETGGMNFSVSLEDVQTLNEWALEGRMDCTKISYGVLPLITGQYTLLDSGGALGTGVGPLLIAKKPIPLPDISNLRIAIPGKNTTAHLLFSMAFPEAKNKSFMVFHEIEQAVLNGSVDAGVIIHENRFTYQQKGLHKLIDLGDYWEHQLHCPVPLGGIVVKKSIPVETREKLQELIRNSIRYSWSNYPELSEYIRCNAQEMSEDVMRQHINLYVNDYSLSLGSAGRRAVDQLLEIYNRISN